MLLALYEREGDYDQQLPIIMLSVPFGIDPWDCAAAEAADPTHTWVLHEDAGDELGAATASRKAGDLA